MCRTRIPGQCIVPPYIFEKLAQARDPALRARALHSLELSARIRGQRDILSAITLPGVRGVRAAVGGLSRTIYTAGNGTQLPGSQVRGEGEGPTGDAAADEAYDGLGATYRLYQSAFGRNSLDDNGLPLIATVHYGQQYD